MIPGLVVALVVGAALGAANYLVLWLTVKRLAAARSPALLATASFLLRTAAVVLGFYAATKGDPARLAACVAGFVLVRAIAVRRAAPAGTAAGGTR
ncbi:MAG: ATP synthase subunit I [Nitrospirota bacterium]|jgi:F1F0 ATPase subunit 2